MGVVHFSCDGCPDTFSDHDAGSFACSKCERSFCSDKCGAKEVPDPGAKDRFGQEVNSCRFCRYETIEDSDLLAWAIGRLGIARDEAVSRFLGATRTPDVIDAADALAKAVKATYMPPGDLESFATAYLQIRP